MRDYFKMILSKVSFDRKLFRKEYRKSLKYLSSVDAAELKNWLRQNNLSVVEQAKIDNSRSFDVTPNRD